MANKDIIANSMIGEGGFFEGKFDVNGSLRIDGTFEGDLTVSEHLFISPVGRLKTKIVKAESISVAGILVGDIETTEEVQLLSTGRVFGNIHTPKLFLEHGVLVQGQINITGTGTKTLEELLDEGHATTEDAKNRVDFQ